jgi:hypothetical protein
MVLAEFYESFALSKRGQLENEERENTRYSQASTFFKNIKTQIDDARKMLRNKKVLMFRKSSFLPNPLVFQAMDFENDVLPFQNQFIIIIKNMIHNKFIKTLFSLCAFTNIALILYDVMAFPKDGSLVTIIDTVLSFVLILEFLLAILFYGPVNYLKKTSYQKLDLLIIVIIFVNISLEISDGTILFGKEGPLKPIIYSLKIMRIFKLMQKSNLFFFRAMSKLIREILKTLFVLWDFIVIIFVTMIVCSFIGLEIFRSHITNFSM